MGTKNVEIMVSLKYLRNFWRAIKIPLINCEINLILTQSANCVVSSGTATNQAAISAITDVKICSTSNFID